MIQAPIAAKEMAASLSLLITKRYEKSSARAVSLTSGRSRELSVFQRLYLLVSVRENRHDNYSDAGGFDHQMSYGNLHVRENVLYCIGKIVQLATPVAELPQCKE